MTCADVVRRFVEILEDRDWEAWSALLHPDVVYEIPQTRERIRGRDRYLQFNREFPGDWHLTPTRSSAGRDLRVRSRTCRTAGPGAGKAF